MNEKVQLHLHEMPTWSQTIMTEHTFFYHDVILYNDEEDLN